MTKERFKSKRLTLEYKSKGWRFKLVGIPGIVNVNTGEELVRGKIGLQLLNVLKVLSHHMSRVKNLPKAEVEIKFSKVA